MHEQIIICGQLFTAHVVASSAMRRTKKSIEYDNVTCFYFNRSETRAVCLFETCSPPQSRMYDTCRTRQNAPIGYRKNIINLILNQT